MTKLRGMTWNQPRAYDPLVAVSALYGQRHPGVEISWERRSLQDFEHYPVEDLAARYDLIIIDHPHVGEAAANDIGHLFCGIGNNVRHGPGGRRYDVVVVAGQHQTEVLFESNNAHLFSPPPLAFCGAMV